MAEENGGTETGNKPFQAESPVRISPAQSCSLALANIRIHITNVSATGYYKTGQLDSTLFLLPFAMPGSRYPIKSAMQ